MQDDLRTMEEYYKEAIKYQKKMHNAIDMMEAYRKRALSYEDHLFSLASDLGMAAKRCGYDNPARIIEQRGQTKISQKKRKKK